MNTIRVRWRSCDSICQCKWSGHWRRFDREVRTVHVLDEQRVLHRGTKLRPRRVRLVEPSVPFASWRCYAAPSMPKEETLAYTCHKCGVAFRDVPREHSIRRDFTLWSIECPGCDTPNILVAFAYPRWTPKTGH
jgi:hypothetical protein